MRKVTVPQTIAYTRIGKMSPVTCRCCNEYFKSVYSFDLHIREVNKQRVCVVPSTIGMVIKKFSYGMVWTIKNDDSFSERINGNR